MRFFILIFTILVCSNFLSAQSSKNELDTYFKNLMQQADIPGMSVAIINKGKIEYLGALGVRSADTKLPVDENTIFAAASLSKPVFAYAVLKLADAGKFDLDKPLYEYLPYADIQQDERYKRITARMALSHTSGFPNWRNGKLDILFDPGTRYSYSGEGFVYLQKVIEKVTGKPLNDWMREQVFQPLGMTRTSYLWEPTYEENYAIPHNENMATRGKYLPKEGNTAHSLQTTAKDYGTFLAHIMQLQASKKSPFYQMLQLQKNLPVKWGQVETRKDLGWGLGWGLELTNTGTYFWQWGDNGTYKAFVMGNKETGKGVVYFTNSSTGLSITSDVLQKVFGGTHPAVEWLNYDTYDTPAKQLFKNIVNQGFTKAMTSLLTSAGTLKDTALYTEDIINSLGYRLMSEKRYWDAQQILKTNMLTFPQSANVYDSYIDATLYVGGAEELLQASKMLIKLDADNEKGQRVFQQLTQPMSGKTVFKLSGYDDAKYVGVAGEFNNWTPWQNLMPWQDGAWVCQIDLKPGTYQYKFVVDGVWTIDESNAKTSYDTEHHNSVIEVRE